MRASRLTTASLNWIRLAEAARTRFASLPAELTRAKSYPEWTKAFKNYLYREHTLQVWSCPTLKEYSQAEEPERQFRIRLVQASREERDQKVEEMRAKYTPKLAAIQEKIRVAHERLEREQAQASRSTWDATIAMGSSVLGGADGPQTHQQNQPHQGDHRRQGREPGHAKTRRCQCRRRFTR